MHSLVRTFWKNALVWNIFVILVVWAIKEAVTRLAFACPCLDQSGSDWWTSKDARQFYASLFITVPAVVFWIAGIFQQDMTWRCITGWRVQQKFLYPGRSCACFFWTFGVTSLPPITWISLLFLDGRYFECIMANIPAVCLDPGEVSTEKDRLYMLSQVISCTIVFCALLIFMWVKLLAKCCSSMTYYQWKHAQHIAEIEERTFYMAAEEYHRNEMKKKWKTLFSSGVDADWDTVSELPPSVPIRKSKRTFYTPFQDWNGVVIPDKTLRNNQDPLDPNMVTITVRSNSANSCVEVNRPCAEYSNGGRIASSSGRLPPIPPQHFQNGHVIYPPLTSSYETDKYPLMHPDASMARSSLHTSTPKAKRKKSSSKKNKVRDSFS